MDEKFSHGYKHAVRVARNVNVNPTMRRVAGRQIHRCNAPADNLEQYYQRNVAVPLINHIKAELDEQFSDLSVLASSLLCLVPSVLCDRAGDLPNADEIINSYKDDLPSPELLRQELLRFQIRYSSKPKEDRPNTAAKALKSCDDDLFPNIYALLKICATIPATSCECERSASSLRRLYTYNRACMSQERLSSLALMHIHYQVKIDLDEVVNLFATKHLRRLELGTILRD
ncbi:52 kDa repressor of the inhibitor of the protein kinase-like [Acropora muricata]|uniref:52 kDa repressor of the inhibitor of the protein kinase-like n=1 Tax=Acropora muricata TaxID=159855 RepID=UPI0034E4360C